MYLPTMTDEELLRYADQAATTELEKELVKRFKEGLEEADELEAKEDEITALVEENDKLSAEIEELRAELDRERHGVEAAS